PHMTTRPDRRFWYMFVPLALVFIANALFASRALELLLYAAIALFGFTVATIELREGQCLNRPSVTREESPLGFWAEVLVSAGLGFFGARMLWLAL
ncbi:MAG TPA: hypothetical protein VIY30_14150, partial [Burkholderiaceae bacterium]